MSLLFTWFSYSHFLYCLQFLMFYFPSASFCPFSLILYRKFFFCLQRGTSVLILYQFSYSTEIFKILFHYVPSSKLRILFMFHCCSIHSLWTSSFTSIILLIFVLLICVFVRSSEGRGYSLLRPLECSDKYSYFRVRVIKCTQMVLLWAKS